MSRYAQETRLKALEAQNTPLFARLPAVEAERGSGGDHQTAEARPG